MNVLVSSFVIFQLVILLAQSVIFKDCGSVDGVIQSIDVSGCTQEPCPLVRGTNVTMTMTFKSNVASNTAVNTMYGIIAGVPVPYALPESDGCKLGINCPIVAGQTYTESAIFQVLPEYPTISLFVKLELKDDQNNDLGCYIIPAKIIDKN